MAAVSSSLAPHPCRHCPQSRPSTPTASVPPDAAQLLDSAWHGGFVGTSVPAGTALLQPSDGGPTPSSSPSRARSPVAVELPPECSAGCLTRMENIHVTRPSCKAAAASRSHSSGSSAAPHNLTAGPFGAASSSVSGSGGTSCGYSFSSNMDSSGDLQSHGAASSCWKELCTERSGALPAVHLSAVGCMWANGPGGSDGGCSSGSGSAGRPSPSITPIGGSGRAAGGCQWPGGRHPDSTDSAELLALSGRVKRRDGRQALIQRREQEAQGPRHGAEVRSKREAAPQRPRLDQKLGALPPMTAV